MFKALVTQSKQLKRLLNIQNPSSLIHTSKVLNDGHEKEFVVSYMHIIKGENMLSGRLCMIN